MKEKEELGMIFVCYNLDKQLGFLFAQIQSIEESTDKDKLKIMYEFHVAAAQPSGDVGRL